MNKLLKKQLKGDAYIFYTNFIAMAITIPVLYLFFVILKNPIVAEGRGFVNLILQLMIPFAILSYTVAYFNIYAKTILGIGGSRRNIFRSQLILIIPVGLVYGIIPILATGVMALVFNPEQASSIFSTVLSPFTWILLICGSMFGLGVGSLFSILVNRFGRKVYLIVTIISIGVIGGTVGAVTAISSHNTYFLDIGEKLWMLIYGGEFVIGLIGYMISKKAIFTMEVR